MADSASALESIIPPRRYPLTIKLDPSQAIRQMRTVHSHSTEDNTRQRPLAHLRKHLTPHIPAPKERPSHSRNSAASFNHLWPRKNMALPKRGGKVPLQRLRHGPRLRLPSLDILQLQTIDTLTKTFINIER